MGDTTEIVEHYKSLSIGDETTLVVRGASVQEVADALGGLALDDVPEGELDGDEPIWATYALAAVELETEGLVVLGKVATGITAADLHVGMVMQLELDTSHRDDTNEYIVYVWAPATPVTASVTDGGSR